MPHSNKQDTKKVSSAKISGLKSTFVINENKLLVTSFGNGNEAIPEYKLTKDGENWEAKIISNGNENRKIEISLTRIPDEDESKSEEDSNDTAEHNEFDKIYVKRIGKENIKGQTDNPIAKQERKMDQIGLRDKLEEYYFGETFDDNIHIQIAYCIRDIDKMLSQHINDIKSSINNLVPEIQFNNITIPEGNEDNDLIAYFKYNKKFANFLNDANMNNSKSIAKPFDELCNSGYLGYYGLTVVANAEEGLTKEDLYYLFCVLSFVRQSLAHPEKNNNLFNLCWSIDQRHGHTYDDILGVLNKLYDNKINEIDVGFIKKQKRNIKIISDVLKQSESDINSLIQIYYRFYLNNEYKNLGFSIKKLREEVLNIFMEKNEIDSLAYDKYKRNINNLVDFIIYYDFITNNKIDEIVEQLRASAVNEDEKNKIYKDYAEKNTESIYQEKIKLILKLVDINSNALKIYTANENFDYEGFVDIRESNGFNVSKIREILKKEKKLNELYSEDNIAVYRIIDLIVDYEIYSSCKDDIDTIKTNAKNSLNTFKNKCYNELGNKYLKKFKESKLYKKLNEGNGYFLNNDKNFYYVNDKYGQNDGIINNDVITNIKSLFEKFDKIEENDRITNQYINFFKLKNVLKEKEIIQKIYDKYNEDEHIKKIDKLISFKIYYDQYNLKMKSNNKDVELIKFYKNKINKKNFNKCLADECYSKIENDIENIKNKIINSTVSALFVDEDTIRNAVNDIKISNCNDNNDNSDIFCKMIYAITLFMDGKEINELLTGLINIFDNISSFMDVLEKNRIEVSFTDKFSIFNDSKKIVDNLKIINSIARVNKNANVKEYSKQKKALYLLGCKNDDIISIIGRKTDNRIDRNIRANRNYINNNILKSPKYTYLARYCNTSMISNIVKNKSIVRLVLNNMPQEQILSYNDILNEIVQNNNQTSVNLSAETDDISAENVINLLTELLTDFNYNSIFLDEKKELYKSFLNLYMTVLYIAAKNISHINSRYFIAFDMFLRDNNTSEDEQYYEIIKESTNALTHKDKENNKKTFCKCFLGQDSTDISATEANIDNSKLDNIINNLNYIIKAFRNSIEHMTVVRSIGDPDLDENFEIISDVFTDETLSDLEFKDVEFKRWFDVYHYILQIIIFKKIIGNSNHTKDQNGFAEKYLRSIIKYKKYSKDALKAMCLPFAYNLPRYKNLTTESLFDMNR